MKLIPPLFKYESLNVLRGKWLIAYVILFAAFSEGLLQFGTDSAKAVSSLMSLVLMIIPMVSVFYASIYWYNAENFTHLLLTQPTQRSRIFLSRWIAVSFALASGFVLGTLIPFALNGVLDGASLILLGLGVLLTFIFVAFGLAVSVFVPDRMKGIGAAFLIWFYFGVVHDSLVFLILSTFNDYPLEVPSMILTAANPIDLARVLVLMSLDFSAMMGYTGAILQKALTTPWGYGLIGAVLAFWTGVPAWIGLRRFRTRDL